MDLCGKRLVESQDAMLTAYGLPDRAPRVDIAKVLAAIPRDKKARRGKVAWVMPRRLGHAEPGHAVPPAIVRRVLRKALA
jgi:3-dehydroquinate synthetase